jgi:hypothetical protein
MSTLWVTGIIAFIVWFALLVATMNVAGTKGRSVVLWGILGFFLPVIALIVVLLLPAKQEQSYQVD